MKNLKRILSVWLMLTLFLSVLTSCDGASSVNDTINLSTTTDENKWVLVSETKICKWMNGGNTCETIYGYDENGRLNYKKYSEFGNDYEYSDFKYDENDNVIAYIEYDALNKSEGISYYEFKYDEKGNCSSYTINSDFDGETFNGEYTFTYDDNANVIIETSNEYEEYSGGFSREVTNRYHNLTYENGLCIQSEINLQGKYITEEEQEEETYYCLEMYSYDANGNKTSKSLYYETTGNYDIEVNGKGYLLNETTTYTWKKFGELNDSSTANNESNSRNGFPEPVQLKQISTDGKTSLKSKPYYLSIDGLYLISDTDGYDYLVLTYTVRNQLLNAKVETDIGSINLVQNGEKLNRYFNLSEECQEAYSDIISDDAVPNELRPDETRTETKIFEVYDTTSDIQLKISPDYYYGDDPDRLILQEYSFD